MSGLVVGYDGSDCSRAALAHALDLARGLGAPVIVAFGFAVEPLGGEISDYAAALREHGEEVLGHALDQARAGGVEVETVLVEQSPAPALAQLGRERDADMIVVGTHGESPLKGALLGSTPHKLLQLSERPVLVVPDRPA